MKESLDNWVVCHPLYNPTKQDFDQCSIWNPHFANLMNIPSRLQLRCLYSDVYSTVTHPKNVAMLHMMPLLPTVGSPRPYNLIGSQRTPCDDVKVGSKYAETTWKHDATTVSYHKFCTPEKSILGALIVVWRKCLFQKKGRLQKLALQQIGFLGFQLGHTWEVFEYFRSFRHSIFKPKHIVNWLILPTLPCGFSHMSFQKRHEPYIDRFEKKMTKGIHKNGPNHWMFLWKNHAMWNSFQTALFWSQHQHPVSRIFKQAQTYARTNNYHLSTNQNNASWRSSHVYNKHIAAHPTGKRIHLPPNGDKGKLMDSKSAGLGDDTVDSFRNPAINHLTGMKPGKQREYLPYCGPKKTAKPVGR